MTSLSNLVPKAELSAYQRWELGSLAEAANTQLGGGHGVDSAGDCRHEADVANEEARRNGHAEGYAAGMIQALEARARLAALLASLSENGNEHRQHLLDEVLNFSLLLAQRMVGEALSIRRELVLPLVSAALKELPQVNQSVQLMLNPADVELVRGFLAAEPTPVACALVADAAIAPGGCRIVTERCEVDATLQTRWRRVLATLGCDDEWLEPV